jgi:branched-chain amino acid aminotransferase
VTEEGAEQRFVPLHCAGKPGPITKKLQERFLSIVEGRGEDRYGWPTLCAQPVAAGR